MSVMEFILVAHAIIVGLAVAEILRGLADMVRAEDVRISYRLLLIAGWTLLLLWQVWWAIWQVGDRTEWTFPEFLISLTMPRIISAVCISRPSNASRITSKASGGINRSCGFSMTA